MNNEWAIARLEQDALSFTALCSSVDKAQMRWKPTVEAWSLLEVICHLYDEEREDFRTRLHLLLHAPDAAWPPIDPPGWVVERKYNERDPEVALKDFLRERDQSVAWLRALEAPDWTSSGLAPWGDSFTAGQMLACWLAHDMLHLRQMAELHYRYSEALASPAPVAYAGGW